MPLSESSVSLGGTVAMGSFPFGEDTISGTVKQTYTGNTLSDSDSPVALEAIAFPKPVIGSALSFSKQLDSGKVGEALNRLVRDDPTLKTHTDDETKGEKK